MPVPPPPPNPNVSSFYHYPKKKVVKGRDYWSSEFLGQLERKKKSKQSLDVIETETQEVNRVACLSGITIGVYLHQWFLNLSGELLRVLKIIS